MTRHAARGSAHGDVAAALIVILIGTLAGCASQPGAESAAMLPTEVTFWPPAPNEPRIQFVRAFRLSSDVERKRSTIDRLVFGDETRPLPIAKPYGVELWNDRLYVCDITNPSVVILDLRARQTRLMVTRGPEQMVQPTDIAIADDGMKYVIDRRRGRIFVFNADDRHVATLGEPGLVPTGVAVHADELYVPDFETQSVLVLDRFRGERRRTIGGPGGGDGQFIRPLGVHVDRAGAVYVGDAISGRVQKFDRDGAFVLAVGQLGDTPGSFVRPKHLAVDDEGILYVVDASFQNVQMFDAEGRLLMYFGGPGEFDGSMSLPAGIAIRSVAESAFADLVHPAFEARRLVVVTNQFGPNKIAVYAMGALREGYSVADITPVGAALPGASMPSP